MGADISVVRASSGEIEFGIEVPKSYRGFLVNTVGVDPETGYGKQYLLPRLEAVTDDQLSEWGYDLTDPTARRVHEDFIRWVKSLEDGDNVLIFDY